MSEETALERAKLAAEYAGYIFNRKSFLASLEAYEAAKQASLPEDRVERFSNGKCSDLNLVQHVADAICAPIVAKNPHFRGEGLLDATNAVIDVLDEYFRNGKAALSHATPHAARTESDRGTENGDGAQPNPSPVGYSGLIEAVENLYGHEITHEDYDSIWAVDREEVLALIRQHAATDSGAGDAHYWKQRYMEMQAQWEKLAFSQHAAATPQPKQAEATPPLPDVVERAANRLKEYYEIWDREPPMQHQLLGLAKSALSAIPQESSRAEMNDKTACLSKTPENEKQTAQEPKQREVSRSELDARFESWKSRHAHHFVATSVEQIARIAYQAALIEDEIHYHITKAESEGA